jgi:Methylene-tetrahydrofolate reductase C terminal
MTDAWPRPARPRLAAGLVYRLAPWLAPNRFYRRLARGLESSRLGYRLFTSAEQAAKGALFGCRMCGQCALPATGYACPESCPKRLRNGPCGGVGPDGSCEVFPGTRCVWLTAWERAERHGHLADLSWPVPPADHRRQGESAWVNYWLGRDGARR